MKITCFEWKRSLIRVDQVADLPNKRCRVEVYDAHFFIHKMTTEDIVKTLNLASEEDLLVFEEWYWSVNLKWERTLQIGGLQISFSTTRRLSDEKGEPYIVDITKAIALRNEVTELLGVPSSKTIGDTQ